MVDILSRIKFLIQESQEKENLDMLKSCFMLTEAFYGLHSEDVHKCIHEIVLG